MQQPSEYEIAETVKARHTEAAAWRSSHSTDMFLRPVSLRCRAARWLRRIADLIDEKRSEDREWQVTP